MAKLLTEENESDYDTLCEITESPADCSRAGEVTTALRR